MSDMMSVETQQQQQQHISSSSQVEHRCKNCSVNFESEKSLEVHLRYHQENLMNQWANKTQQEESNNNHKTGNHNSHVSVSRDSVTVPIDSSESSSMSPSRETTNTQQTPQQQQQQQPPQPPQPQPQPQPQSQPQPQQQQSPQQHQQQSTLHPIVCQSYDYQIFNDPYYIPNENYLSNSYPPSQEEIQANGRDNYARFHPYYAPDHGVSNSASSRSPPFSCDKCSIVYDDANQLGEHLRTSHLNSPSAFPPQYQQLGSSPQNQQLHPSPHSNHPQQQTSYDYNGVQPAKSEMKQESEEQAEILDLDSHKVQTHRYEEDLRMQQQQQQQQQQHQQRFQIPMQHHHQHVIQQQHSIGSHSMTSMLSWPTQTHEFHSGLPMVPMDNVQTIGDQPFIRTQSIHPVEHQGSPILANTQSISNQQISPGFAQPASTRPNQSWKSNEPRRPKTYNCTACNKWFTSSGHLKRHYNTTLHKNAVKGSKEPDPSTLPITAHHHPRENNSCATSNRGGASTRSSPNLSRSPPNLIAGPSGEATRGLLILPNNAHNNFSNNNDNCTAAVLAMQQQQQQQQQQQHHQQQLVHLGLIPLTSPQVPSQLLHHQQQVVDSAPLQLDLQQQQQPPQQQPQQQLLLPMGSPVQSIHSSTPIPLSPASHLTSPMDTSPVHPHHMNSPIQMEDTTIQLYPNVLSPHVTPTINQALQHIKTPIIMVTPTTGPEQPLPSFRAFIKSVGSHERYVYQNEIQTIANVGGLDIEETIPSKSYLYSYRFCPSTHKSMTLCESTIIQTPKNGKCFVYGDNNNIQVLDNSDFDLPLKKKRRSGRKCRIKNQKNKHQEIMDFVFPRKKISKEDNKPVKCPKCGKEVQSQCYLTQHINSQHSGEKAFRCSTCGKKFHTEVDRDKHKEKHKQEKKFECMYINCNKQFVHKTDLKRHEYGHSDKKPFECSICNKGFIRQDHLRKHEQAHERKQMNQNRRNRTFTAEIPVIHTNVTTFFEHLPSMVNDLDLTNSPSLEYIFPIDDLVCSSSESYTLLEPHIDLNYENA